LNSDQINGIQEGSACAEQFTIALIMSGRGMFHQAAA
jgi:hypothetical protein